MSDSTEEKTELEKRIETMRTLERAFNACGQPQRARDMRNRREDLEVVLAAIKDKQSWT